MMITCFGKARISAKSRKRDSTSFSPPRNWTSRDDDDGEEGGKIIFFGGKNHLFDLDDLLSSSAEVLGKGAFGTTYKVTVEDMSTVVVKRLKKVVAGRREFEQQMEIIGMIRHENVAELKAYYFSKDDKLAVYSYYPQGSLFQLLHGKRGMYDRVPLDWEARLRIATGAARGLAKIHEGNNGRCIHGNIKSSNIFLDSQRYGCIGDIGLTTIMRSLPQSTCLTSGYHAPEITDTRRSTQSSDVYSFGVVLLELLTGKSPAASHGENMDLASWIRNVVAKDWTWEVFDMEIVSESGGGGGDVEEEMVEMLQIGLACVGFFSELVLEENISHLFPSAKPLIPHLCIKFSLVSTIIVIITMSNWIGYRPAFLFLSIFLLRSRASRTDSTSFKSDAFFSFHLMHMINCCAD